jgi:predicted DCC family thiol-disulfide oxidoreductase YuxK
MENSTATKSLVLFDGDCAFCQRSVRILKSFDWFRQFQFQTARDTEQLPVTQPPLDPVKMLEEMHVVSRNRDRVYVGFSAFRWMAWRMPLTALLAPFLYLPGVLWLGNRAYRWVAKNRFNLVPCDNGGCKVVLKK